MNSIYRMLLTKREKDLYFLGLSSNIFSKNTSTEQSVKCLLNLRINPSIQEHSPINQEYRPDKSDWFEELLDIDDFQWSMRSHWSGIYDK